MATVMLDLATPADVIHLLRKDGYFNLADQIEAQLPKPDPLEALIEASVDGLSDALYRSKKIGAAAVREFAEKVRALATEDTVPADKLRAAERQIRRFSERSPSGDRTWAYGRCADLIAALIPEEGQ